MPAISPGRPARGGSAAPAAERNRFMKGLSPGSASTPSACPTRGRAAAGATKFNLWRLWNFALDGVVSFSTTPLRAWFYVGGGIAGAAFLYAMFIVARVLILGVDAPGYASLLVVVLMMGGIQLLSLGIIGEYLAASSSRSKAADLCRRGCLRGRHAAGAKD